MRFRRINVYCPLQIVSFSYFRTVEEFTVIQDKLKENILIKETHFAKILYMTVKNRFKDVMMFSESKFRGIKSKYLLLKNIVT